MSKPSQIRRISIRAFQVSSLFILFSPGGARSGCHDSQFDFGGNGSIRGRFVLDTSRDVASSP